MAITLWNQQQALKTQRAVTDATNGCCGAT